MDQLFLWVLLSLLCFKFVYADQRNMTAEPGETVTLQCRAADNETISVVQWSRTDLKKDYVLVYRNKGIDPSMQHSSFKHRVDLQDRDLKDGNVSIVLKNTMTNDSGTYQCGVAYTGRDMNIISSINLDVSPPTFPSPPTLSPPPTLPPPSSPPTTEEPSPHKVTVLVVLVVLVLLVLLGIGPHVWHSYMSVQQVEGESEAEVERRDEADDVVQVYQNGSDQPEEQHLIYRMNKDPVGSRDLSLGDSGAYSFITDNTDEEDEETSLFEGQSPTGGESLDSLCDSNL